MNKYRQIEKDATNEIYERCTMCHIVREVVKDTIYKRLNKQMCFGETCSLREYVEYCLVKNVVEELEMRGKVIR